MNCHADTLATDFLDNWSEPSKLVSFIPASKASVAIAGVTITRNLARRLRQAASSPALQEHIMLKNGWNDWIFHSIDWNAQAKALNTLEYNQELFVTKWAHNLLPTRRHMERIGKAESDLCPSCLETIETAPHIFACERRVEWQATFLDSLRKLLATLYTQPDLQMILMVGIQGAPYKMIRSSTCQPPTANQASSSKSPRKTTSDGRTCYEAASAITGSRFSRTTSTTRTKSAPRSSQANAGSKRSSIINGPIYTLPGNSETPIFTALMQLTKKPNARQT